MSECRPRSTPSEQKLESVTNDEEVKNETVNPKEYCEIGGSLIYARPDIGWVVSKKSQHVQSQKQRTWQQLSMYLGVSKVQLD